MDNVIFEDPSKQRPRAKRPSPVQPVEVIQNQAHLIDGEQQRCARSQSLDAFNPKIDGSGRLFERFTNYVNCHKDGQVYETPTRSDFDPPGVAPSSVLELFSIPDIDRHSVDDDCASQRDSLFSSPEPEGSAVDRDTSVYSIVDKCGEGPTLERLESFNQAGRGKHQDVAILFEDDVSDGDARNSVALQTAMLESEVGKPASRNRPSPPDRDKNDDVEPGTEDSERGENVHHITRKKRRVRRPESPSQVPGARDDQASFLKVSDSRLCHNLRADQERGIQKSIPLFPRSRVSTTSSSRSLSLGPDKGQHNLEQEVVWEYGHLLHYRIVHGNPQVLVPWVPTWEPAGEYPPEDVERVRRQSQGQMQARRRGRPRSKHHIRM